jgi:hypothetical protein
MIIYLEIDRLVPILGYCAIHLLSYLKSNFCIYRFRFNLLTIVKL